MATHYHIQPGLQPNTNNAFRVGTRLYHLFIKNSKVPQYPIIINNFNRLYWLQQQIDWLRSVGQHNIHIIDNGSTYAPLLAYYKKVKATVYYLDANVGHEALWRTHIHQRLGKYYHVYTDPDVLPNADTPTDFMFYFTSLLAQYPQYKKVGFGLQTNNLPNHYPQKKEVIQWEQQFYTNAIAPNVYAARIDTTFALYRPGAAYQCWDATLRTGGAYMLRHEPWYEDPLHLSAESLFYTTAASEVSSWYKAVANENDTYSL